jgi:hypothetical protein
MRPINRVFALGEAGAIDQTREITAGESHEKKENRECDSQRGPSRA